MKELCMFHYDTVSTLQPDPGSCLASQPLPSLAVSFYQGFSRKHLTQGRLLLLLGPSPVGTISWTGQTSFTEVPLADLRL